MTTARQIGEMIQGGPGRRVWAELAQNRGDLPDWLAADLGGSAVGAAAVAVIRLSELEQTTFPIYAGLVRQLLIAQEADGGWGNTLITALVIRALAGIDVAAPARALAIDYLASLQKEDGAWPLEPFRRMPADPTATAFILVQLGRDRQFLGRVRLEAAIGSLNAAVGDLSDQQRQLARLALLRSGARIAGQAQGLLRWS
jgi:hypothetical protein